MTKKILITGENSYIGNQLAEWLDKKPDRYEVQKISVRDDKWKKIDFSTFDVVVHVAGIAHIKETKKNEIQYYAINRDLAFNIAKKSRENGVNNFIFLSSMSVYGKNENEISFNTLPNPDSYYGKSKFEAEILINSLVNDYFKVAIMRPPMIYGKNCKGNYSKIAKLAKHNLVFPNMINKRSMIHIDNLNELLYLIIKNRDSGVFLPQNSEYVNTVNLVMYINEIYGKNVMLTNIFNPLILFLSKKIKILNKVFGDYVYSKDSSKYSENYEIHNFKESINVTERKRYE